MTERSKTGPKSNPDLRRVHIKVNPKVHDWFSQRSIETGAPMGVLMSLALEQHIQQQEMSAQLPTLLLQMKKMQQMEQMEQLQQLQQLQQLGQLNLLKNA